MRAISEIFVVGAGGDLKDDIKSYRALSKTSSYRDIKQNVTFANN